MTTLAAISLDEHWYYKYFSDHHTDDIVETVGGALIAITDWVGLEFPDSLAWVWRTFTLEPTEVCVRYYLYIASMPQVALIAINDHKINPTTTPPPYKFDVTDYVTLDENVIGFRVIGAGGAFGRIRLQPVACDEP